MDLSVEIITPEELLYSGPATALSTKNSAGPLSLLPQHTNFISVIEEQISLHLPDGSQQRFQIDQGVLYCRENKVEIYVGISGAVRRAPEHKTQNEPGEKRKAQSEPSAKRKTPSEK